MEKAWDGVSREAHNAQEAKGGDAEAQRGDGEAHGRVLNVVVIV